MTRTCYGCGVELIPGQNQAESAARVLRHQCRACRAVYARKLREEKGQAGPRKRTIDDQIELRDLRLKVKKLQDLLATLSADRAASPDKDQ